MQNCHKNYQPAEKCILSKFHTAAPFLGWSAHSEVQNTLKTTKLPMKTLTFLSSYWNVILCASLRNAQSTPSKQGQHCNPTGRDTPIFPQAWSTNKAAKSTRLTGNFVSTTRHMGLKSHIRDRINLPSGKVWRHECKIGETWIHKYFRYRPSWTAQWLYFENKNKVRGHIGCELLPKIIKGWQDAVLEEIWDTAREKLLSSWLPCLGFGRRNPPYTTIISIFTKAGHS